MSTPQIKRRLSTGERTVIVALIMIIVQLAFRGWAAAGSWFYSDDFIFLGVTARGEATAQWLFEPHNVHLMPFGLLLAKWVGSAGAFNWALAAAQIIALQLIASLLCWWMLRKVFGDRPGILLALGFYLFSTLSFPTVMWWAAALNQLPHQIAIFGAIGAHFAYLRSRDPRLAALATLFLIFGFASYSKTLILPFVLVAVAFCYFAEGRLLRRAQMTITRHWHAWAMYGAVSVGYLVLYFGRVPRSKVPSWNELWGTLNLSIGEAFGSAVAGGPWQWEVLSLDGGSGPRLFVATSVLLVATSWVAAALLWGFQVLRFKRAGWPALILFPYLALSGFLIASGRTGAFGVDSASLELRYLADLGAIGALCLGLTTMSALGSNQPLVPRGVLRENVTFDRRIVIAVTVVFVTGSIFSSVQYARPWHNSKTMTQRSYIDNARAALKAENVEVADSGVPVDVLWAAAFPRNLVSYVLAPFGNRFSVVDSGTDIKMFGEDGKLTAATVESSPRSKPGPDKGCGYAVATDPVTIKITPVIDFSFWMSISYLAGSDGTLTVEAGANRFEMPVSKGLHTAFVRTLGAYDRVVLTAGQGAALCVDNVNVGLLSPQARQ